MLCELPALTPADPASFLAPFSPSPPTDEAVVVMGASSGNSSWNMSLPVLEWILACLCSEDETRVENGWVVLGGAIKSVDGGGDDDDASSSLPPSHLFGRAPIEAVVAGAEERGCMRLENAEADDSEGDSGLRLLREGRCAGGGMRLLTPTLPSTCMPCSLIDPGVFCVS